MLLTHGRLRRLWVINAMVLATMLMMAAVNTLVLSTGFDLSLTKMNLATVVGLSFVALSGLAVLRSLPESLTALRLLKRGRVGSGQVISRGPLSTEGDHDVMFCFVRPDGARQRFSMAVPGPPPLSSGDRGDEREALLYLEEDASAVVAVQGLPGRLRPRGDDGDLEVTDPRHIRALVFPVLVALEVSVLWLLWAL